MTLQEQMQELESLAGKIGAQRYKIEELKSVADEKIEKMNEQISNMQEVIEFLKAGIEKVADNYNEDEQALNIKIEKDYDKAQERIEKFSEKVVISNEMLAKLLNKATPNVKWLIHLVEYEGYLNEPNGKFFGPRNMIGLFAFSSVAHGYSVVDKEEYKNAFDVTVNEQVDMQNKNFALLFEQSGTRYHSSKIEYFKNFNWVEPYLLRKITNDYDDVIPKPVKLPKGLFGDVIYEVIDQYVTNLLASKKEGTKKPTAKK